MATTQGTTKPAVIAVFCGSVSGKNPKHLETARALAHELHKNKAHLVYGGGTIGLMGEIARTLVKLSGPEAVHGVIPRALIKKEPGFENQNGGEEATGSGKGAERVLPDPASKNDMLHQTEYGTITIVPDMHTRKRLMATKVVEGGPGSGFVSLAGGFGTIEEVMEMTTWNQLGIHKVGVVLLNVEGYWDGLLAWVKNAVQEGYISPDNGSILVEAKSVGEVWNKLVEYKVSVGRMQLNWGEE